MFGFAAAVGDDRGTDVVLTAWVRKIHRAFLLAAWSRSDPWREHECWSCGRIFPVAPFADRAHMVAVADSARDATFEAVEMKDGSGWYVRLTRSAMLPQQIGDFKTEAEARQWIADASAKWLERYGVSKPA